MGQTNLDRPRGLEPHGELLRATSYVGVGTLFPGETVLRESGGRVAIGTVSTALAGVALSYCSATGQQVLVADHPDQLFVVQADGSDIDAQADIGLNYTCLVTAQDATYKLSRMEVDVSTGQTSAARELHVIEVNKRPDNVLGDNVDVIVRINNHCFGGSTGTIGV